MLVHGPKQLRSFGQLLERLEGGENAQTVLNDAKGLALPEAWIGHLQQASQASGLGYGGAAKGGAKKPLGAGTALFLGQAPPPKSETDEAIVAAKSAIATALTSAPRGAAKSPLFNIGEGFAQHFAEGSNHPHGSMLVTSATSGLAEPIINGFFMTYVSEQPLLGGAPLYTALGRPSGPEAPDPDYPGVNALQVFEHGRMRWTPEKGVWVEPEDLLKNAAAKIAAFGPAPKLRSDLPLATLVPLLEESLPPLLALRGKLKGAALSKDDLEACALDITLPEQVRSAAQSLLARPGLFERLAPEGLTRAALDRALAVEFLAQGALPDAEHEHSFKAWAAAQVAANPHINHVYGAIDALVKGPERPTRVGELLEKTRAIAAASLADDPLFPDDPRTAQQLIMLTSLVALAAHGLQNAWGPASTYFPSFIADGRPFDRGHDKCWHTVNQAMYAFVTLFDSEYGQKEIRAAFEKQVEHTDQWGAAAWVSKAYDRTRGALGGYLADSMPGPPGEPTVYVERPKDLSPDEANAYNYAVRIGDAHEYHPVFGDPSKIGESHWRHDPVATLNGNYPSVASLSDPGVSRDLSANRLGARLGIMAYRQPSAFMSLPWDDPSFAQNSFAAGRPIPSTDYLAYELLMQKRLGSLEGDPDKDLALLRQKVKSQGRSASLAEVSQGFDQAVDALFDTDKDRLCRYYANTAVRYLSWGWRVPNLEGESQSYSDHHQWALGQSKDVLKQEFLRRVKGASSAFEAAPASP